jgi:hypothetical protein
MRFNNVRAITVFVSLFSGLGSVSCRAQPPAPPPPPPPGPSAFAAPQPPPPPRGHRGPLPPGPAAQGSRTTLRGVVRDFNYGPGGLDGLILDQGTVVHFPPEYGTQVSSAAPIGSAIAASGWSHIGPAGDTLFDADAITNERSRASITLTAGPPPPPPPVPPPPGPSAFAAPPPPPPRGGRGPLPPGPAAQGSQTTVSGVVRSFNYGPGGLDGLILDQGTVVHFPPEYSSQVSSAVPIGSAIAASGWSHIGPAGDTLFDADTITNQRSRGVITMTGRPEATLPPPPPPGPAAYAGQPPAPPAPGPWPSQMPAATPVPPTAVTGVVRSFNYGFDGQVNGLILSDGTAIYFSPEIASQVTRTVAISGRVRVTGSLRTGPTGNRLIDAQIITNRQTGVSFTVPNTAFPPAP